MPDHNHTTRNAKLYSCTIIPGKYNVTLQSKNKNLNVSNLNITNSGTLVSYNETNNGMSVGNNGFYYYNYTIYVENFENNSRVNIVSNSNLNGIKYFFREINYNS